MSALLPYIVPGLLFVALGAVAALHFYWAAGGVWPGSDAADLSSLVVGDPRRPGMAAPKDLAAIGGWFAVAALLALVLAFRFGPPIDKALAWVGAAVGVLFAARGLSGYLPFWRAVHPGVKFTLLDKRFYSPFCVLVAEGFYLLVSGRF